MHQCFCVLHRHKSPCIFLGSIDPPGPAPVKYWSGNSCYFCFIYKLFIQIIQWVKKYTFLHFYMAPFHIVILFSWDYFWHHVIFIKYLNRLFLFNLLCAISTSGFSWGKIVILFVGDNSFVLFFKSLIFQNVISNDFYHLGLTALTCCFSCFSNNNPANNGFLIAGETLSLPNISVSLLVDDGEKFLGWFFFLSLASFFRPTYQVVSLMFCFYCLFFRFK